MPASSSPLSFLPDAASPSFDMASVLVSEPLPDASFDQAPDPVPSAGPTPQQTQSPPKPEAPVNVSCLVIGSGPAGYTAAIYLARYGRDVIVAMGTQPGGQLTLTTEIENFPGFAQPVQGPWLMDQCRQQAAAYGADLRIETITKVDFSKRPYVCTGSSGTNFICQSVIIATGATTKWLGLPSEEAFLGFGVSSCATCDGRMFKGLDVAVVGGGNTAIEEALFLAQLASHVTVIHRRDVLRADKILQDRALSHPKISFLWNSAVQEVLGQTDPIRRVTGVGLVNTQTGQTQSLDLRGLFVAIGHTPNTSLFKDFLPCDSDGYLVGTPGSSKSVLDGVFLAGDVQDKIYRQAITAAGQGCMAAMDAERFLQGGHPA
jgi:thioredoxin reductase (NADPH)